VKTRPPKFQATWRRPRAQLAAVGRVGLEEAFSEVARCLSEEQLVLKTETVVTGVRVAARAAVRAAARVAADRQVVDTREEAKKDAVAVLADSVEAAAVATAAAVLQAVLKVKEKGEAGAEERGKGMVGEWEVSKEAGPLVEVQWEEGTEVSLVEVATVGATEAEAKVGVATGAVEKEGAGKEVVVDVLGHPRARPVERKAAADTAVVEGVEAAIRAKEQEEEGETEQATGEGLAVEVETAEWTVAVVADKEAAAEVVGLEEAHVEEEPVEETTVEAGTVEQTEAEGAAGAATAEGTVEAVQVAVVAEATPVTAERSEEVVEEEREAEKMVDTVVAAWSVAVTMAEGARAGSMVVEREVGSMAATEVYKAELGNLETAKVAAAKEVEATVAE